MVLTHCFRCSFDPRDLPARWREGLFVQKRDAALSAPPECLRYSEPLELVEKMNRSAEGMLPRLIHGPAAAFVGADTMTVNLPRVALVISSSSSLSTGEAAQEVLLPPRYKDIRHLLAEVATSAMLRDITDHAVRWLDEWTTEAATS